MTPGVGRFAPSTTGWAHPGTLLAALLAWLDARSRGDRFVVRLENLDPQRSRSLWEKGMIEALTWLGLDWDVMVRQSDLNAQHAEALDALASRGLLYACTCSRAVLRRDGRRAPDGGWAYVNRCRPSAPEPLDWRRCPHAVRLRLPAGSVEVVDESGAFLGRDPQASFGDPLVRRRDGAVAYGLAVVVDDARAGITRVIRGHDIAPATALQVGIGALLGRAIPTYRHHLLLLENRDKKLAKMHGAVGWPVLREHYRGSELCGFLAWVSGLQEAPKPITPSELVPRFTWSAVGTQHRSVHWDGHRLHAPSEPIAATLTAN